ncbi:MAG: response regulator [Myxococcaceae bacterium]|nr:response regulator [Myxococcaceae bacterium]
MRMTPLAHKRTVLLVEDYPPDRESFRKYLEEGGYHVVTANDYAAAVAALQAAKKPPHVVCADLTLPRESGYELCEFMRKEPRFLSVPILVMSDRVSPEDMAYAEQVGANAFLKKPFTRERMLKYVTALLDGANASRPSVRRLKHTDPPPPPSSASLPKMPPSSRKT